MTALLDAPAPSDAPAGDFSPGTFYHTIELRRAANKSLGRNVQHVCCMVELQRDGRFQARALHAPGAYWEQLEQLYLGWDLQDAVAAAELFTKEALAGDYKPRYESKYDPSNPPPRDSPYRNDRYFWNTAWRKHYLVDMEHRQMRAAESMLDATLGEQRYADRELRLACRAARIQAAREHFAYRALWSGVVR